MEIVISFSSDESYQALVKLDQSLRRIENQMRDWPMSRKRERNKHLKFQFARKNKIKRKLGLKGVSGPFYSGHYMDSGKRHKFSGQP